MWSLTRASNFKAQQTQFLGRASKSRASGGDRSIERTITSAAYIPGLDTRALDSSAWEILYELRDER